MVEYSVSKEPKTSRLYCSNCQAEWEITQSNTPTDQTPHMCPTCFPAWPHPEPFIMGASKINKEVLEFSTDELEVLDFVRGGLRAGREVYGTLEAADDPRNFLREAEEELRDSIVYLVGQIQKLRKMRERLECDK